MRNLNKQHLILFLSIFLTCLVVSITLIGFSVFSGPKKNIPLTGKNGMVATDSAICSQMAKDIMEKKKGNAFDATITAALCLGLVHPESSGIGGGGIMMIRTSSGVYDVVNCRELAPKKANQTMFTSNINLSREGGLAVAVPGELKCLEYINKKYSVLSWREVLQPVVDLAENGFVVDKELANSIVNNKARMIKVEGLKKIYFHSNGEPLAVGETLKRPDLAKTLRTLQSEGVDSFYNGSIAQKIFEDMRNSDYEYIFTPEDFRDFQIQNLQPLHSFYRGYELVVPPPPFGSVVNLLALNILERYRFDKSVSSYHNFIESMRFGFSDRMALGDPDFVANVSSIIVPAMMSKQHASYLRSKISPEKAFDPSYYEDLHPLTHMVDDRGTTHFSIVDSHQNLIGMTTTVNSAFGSFTFSPSTGILLNDEMGDFSTPGLPNTWGYPPNTANFIEPGKRPLSSMTPTIVLKDTKPYMVLGASGGPLILSATIQTLVNVLDMNMNIEDAVQAPRFHDQLVGITQFEKVLMDKIGNDMRAYGYNVTLRNSIAVCQAVLIDDNGYLQGASDYRKGGKPAGY